MAKLYQILEQTFKMRINSNAEIIPYIKKLSEMGKFDEPKKVAAIAILLDRVAKLEDEADMTKSLSDIASSTINEPAMPQEINPSPSSEVVSMEEMPKVEENQPSEPSNPEAAPSIEVSTQETPATVETPVVEETTNPSSTPIVSEPVDPTPTVAEFSPENISDPTPKPTPDSTTTA